MNKETPWHWIAAVAVWIALFSLTQIDELSMPITALALAVSCYLVGAYLKERVFRK